METLFSIIHFLSAADPDYEYGPIQDWMFGQNGINVFSDTLLFGFLLTIVICALYYFVFNKFVKMNYLWAWFLFAAIAAGICFGISYTYIGSYVYPIGEQIMPFGWKFMGESALWGFIFFYIFSLLFKRWSPFAKNIPH